MSNKIFQVMINFMEQAIFDKLVDKLKFKKKEEAKNVASGNIEGRFVTIYYEGEQFTIIIPNDNLTEEECKKIAKRIITELYILLGIELNIEDIDIKKLGFASGICNYCLIKAFTYKCRRCNGFYCSEHRLPEKHNCPADRKLIFEVKEKEKEKKIKDKKSKKIVIVETHCA